MQRWKAITAVLEKPPDCLCGAAVAPDWAFCARCGRGLARRNVLTPPVVATLAVSIALLSFICGLVFGTRRGEPAAATVAARGDVADVRARLSNAESASRRLKDRNDSLWRQLADRNDSLRKQLIERHESLQTQLKERTATAQKQLSDQGQSIGLLANRAEAADQLEEENAALAESMRDTEEQLKALIEAQQATNQLPASAAGQPERDETATAEAIESFWTRFDTEHPTVNGRDIWEESMRTAVDEVGVTDAAELRNHATRLFEERLARAEESARGTPAVAAEDPAAETPSRQRRRPGR